MYCQLNVPTEIVIVGCLTLQNNRSKRGLMDWCSIRFVLGYCKSRQI